MTKKTLYNPNAGDILKTEFLDELAMSQNALARAIHVPANRIHDIVNGKRTVTADTDLRLCKFFGLSEGYFLRLQMAYDLLAAKQEMLEIINKIKPYNEADKSVGRIKKQVK